MSSISPWMTTAATSNEFPVNVHPGETVTATASTDAPLPTGWTLTVFTDAFGTGNPQGALKTCAAPATSCTASFTVPTGRPGTSFYVGMQLNSPTGYLPAGLSLTYAPS